MAPSQDNPLSSFAPLRILIVDDEGLFVAIATDYYRAQGHEVSAAPNGAVALQMMEAQIPDVVLCDRRMPELSGAEFLRAIRERGPDWQRAIFVFVTALADQRDVEAMTPLRPDAYLTKPIDYARADELLAGLLERRKRGQQIVP